MRSLVEKALRYRRVHGTRKLVRDALQRIVASPVPPAPPGLPAGPLDLSRPVSARELVEARYRSIRPLRLFAVPAGGPRVSLVTDSINRGSLYGGVGTAVILAALIAEARGGRLRVVTRTERAQPAGFAGVLQTYGLPLSQEPEFAYAPSHDRDEDIDLVPRELFITTSWWTTSATLASVPADSVLYLLQEDERMFYPNSDDHLRCATLLARPDVPVVVNTRLLFDHLVRTGLPHLTESGLWFEPAFPGRVFHRRRTRASAKRVLMFYARPNNPRNLFYFGLELLDAAIARGVLDLDAWDVVLVGKDIPTLTFADGRYTPQRLENLSWADYAAFVGQVDLGLSLMYTPHPSYPPLDLAASGAVAVTNRFGLKHDLADRSRNIVCGDLTMASMMTALEEGLRLASADDERDANACATSLARDWPTALAAVVARYGQVR